MTELFFIVVGAIFVNNFVLVQFLGLCPFMGASGRLDTALGMAAATTFVLTLAAGISWLVDHLLLIPLGLDYLRLIAFILVIALLVQLTELTIRKTRPILHQLMGLFLPLITTNCAVLGVALISTRDATTFAGAIALGLGAALGFSAVLLCFAAIRERMDEGAVPAALRGHAIHMTTAGLMSLAFLGFSGMGQ